MAIKIKETKFSQLLPPDKGYLLLGIDSEDGNKIKIKKSNNTVETIQTSLSGDVIGDSVVIGSLSGLSYGERYLANGYLVWPFGNYVQSAGFYTKAEGDYSYSGGMWTTSAGLSSRAFGTYTYAGGDYSLAGGFGIASYLVKASGNGSFNHSATYSLESDILSDNSAILGGVDNNISGTSVNSVILGGDRGIIKSVRSAIIGGINNIVESGLTNVAVIACNGITAISANTVYVPNLVITELGGSGSQMLVIDNNGYISSQTIPSGATISYYGDNRIITSDGTATGLNGEANLQFDGTTLSVNGNIRLGGSGNRVYSREPATTAATTTTYFSGQDSQYIGSITGGSVYLLAGAGYGITVGSGTGGVGGTTNVVGGQGGSIGSGDGVGGAGGATTVVGGTGGSQAGGSGTGGDGGHLTLRGGNAGTGALGSGTSGNVYIYGGTTGTVGNVYLCSNGSTAYGTLIVGNTSLFNNNMTISGNITLSSGSNRTIVISSAAVSDGYDLTVQAQSTSSSSAKGGNLYLLGGVAANTSSIGGDVYINGGNGSSTTNAGNVILQYASGNAGTVLIGTETEQSGYIFRVNGSSYGTDWVASSDIRLKENIITLDNSLDKVLNLRGVYFNWKSDENKERKVGLIAQEVETIYPELVPKTKDDSEIKGVNYDNVVAILIEALKEEHKIVENLQKEVDDLKNLIK
jgi:hypothetical protein